MANRRYLRLALVVVIGAAAWTVWSLGSDARRDAALARELAAAAPSRFAAAFYRGSPAEGSIRVLPLEERDARERSLALLREQAQALDALHGQLRNPADLDAFQELFVLAKAENELERSGIPPTGRFSEELRGLLDAAGRTQFDRLMTDIQLATPIAIDGRDDIFAARVVEAVHALERSEPGSGAVVFVFTGARHVEGVAQRVEQALGVSRAGPAHDLAATFERALAGIDRDSSTAVHAQLAEGLNAGVPDVDIGPVRLRGDVHTPFFDAVREVGFEWFLPEVEHYERAYAVSIQRYADVVDEVRELARAGRHIEFLTELDATTLIDSHGDVLREERLAALEQGLGARIASGQLDGDTAELPLRANRLFPFFVIGPSALLMAQLDKSTLPAPFLRELRR